MLIEKPEDLKMWLTSHLQPLCDADPAALSKYVLALIKKDKTEEELRESMLQQMDVFLQSETQNFVQMLFDVVESKDYITPTQVKEEEVQSDETKVEDIVPKEPKIEADSTTPIRESEKYSEPRPAFDDRRRFRQSPPNERRLASRLGTREIKEPPRRFRSRSRSRELSPRHDRFRSSRRRSRSPNMGRRRSPEMPRRARSVERDHHNSRDSTPTRDEGATGYTPTATKPRCRDYDEKGFCLRGDLCKFDHGTDAVVLEDSAKTAGYQPGAPTEPYIPGIPLGGIPFPPPIMSVPPPGYNHAGGKRPHEGGGYEPPAKRFDYPRLSRGRGRGRGWGGRGGRGGSTMLAVRNIPGDLNTITHLNGHFSRYGSLVNIQVLFEGDPGSALITFSTTDEANAAFTTSEAVLNNRFIKVFWHRSEKGTVKDRLGQQQGNANMILVNGPSVPTTAKEDSPDVLKDAEDPEKVKEEKAQAILAIQKNQEVMKQAEEKRKNALVQQEGLLKSKHELLAGLIEQQKALIAKLEKGKGVIKTEEKSKIMKLLKELSSYIDRTKEDIKTSLSVGGVKNRGVAEIQKELLDAEMELFTLQQDGEETQAVQQKVNTLRLEAARSGLPPTSSTNRGRGFYFRGRGRGFSPRGSMSYFGGGFRGRGRGRGFTISPGNTVLDRRPSSILVSGYELEEKEEILTHFNKFGEIIETVEDEVTPSIIIKFKSRPLAEAAMTDGKNFCDKSLAMAWYNQEQAASQTEADQDQDDDDDGYTPPQDDYLPPGLQEHEDSLGNASKTEENEELDDTGDGSEVLNEDLLDEEEEDGDEERSWKRRSNDED